MKRLPLYLALLLTAVLPCATARAASPDLPDPAALEAFLHQRYYEVEFFVFERPRVLDFAEEEILTLKRPRALPRAVRTQVLTDDELLSQPLDPMTRACLTFPLLTYELVPPEEAPADPTLVPELVEPSADPQPAEETRPLPEIAPELAPDPMLDFLARMATFEDGLIESSQRWQAPEAFQLSREAGRIESRGNGRILFHGRWLQAVPPREQYDPILVTGGQTLRPPLAAQELIGTVGVSLGRYLHFRADLFFHGPALGLTPASAVMAGDGTPTLTPTGAVEAGGYMVLSESRRMRSEELHYLDHPKLGLVVRIDPVRFPDDLVQAFIALEENVE
jgi:hypothetical protein